MHSSDAFGNLKSLAVHALHLSAVTNAAATKPSRTEPLVLQDGIGHHVALPHRDRPTQMLPLVTPPTFSGRKLADVGTGAGATSVTSVSLAGCSNAGYTANATVGGGAKVSGLHMLVDTASSDLLLASTACTDCNVSPVYNATLGRAEHLSLNGTWGSAKWTGLESLDQVDLGGGATSSISLAALTEQHGIFGNAGCTAGNVTNTRQGVLGMGPITLSNSGLKTGYLWGLTNPESIVGIALCDQGGFMYLGSEPVTNTGKGAFKTPLVQSKYYAVEVDAITIGNQRLNASADTLGPAIISSSDRAIFLPQATYASAVQAITAGRSDVTPSFFSNQTCIAAPKNLNLTSLPPLALTMAPATSGGDVSTMSYPASNSYVTYLNDGKGGHQICPALSSSGVGGATVLGNTLMRNTMTTVNWETKLVTIGPSVGVCS